MLLPVVLLPVVLLPVVLSIVGAGLAAGSFGSDRGSAERAGTGHARCVHRLQHDQTEAFDVVEFGRRGDQVERRAQPGEAQRSIVVAVAASGAVAGIGAHQQVEQH
ncbi:MAG TPA: hypothetical protein PLV68_15135 [Ilumatobacteraceae bacterium]|nr:hypothetical protein [Ilumatobacteraceae bacterium]